MALPGHLSKSYQTALNYHKLAHRRHYLWKVEWLENSDLKKLFFSQTEGGLEPVCGVWTSQHSSAHAACVSLLRYIWNQKISKSNQSGYDGSTRSLFIQWIIFSHPGAHIHAGLHLKALDCLYKHFWREHKMSTFYEVLRPFSTQGFETPKNGQKSFQTLLKIDRHFCGDTSSLCKTSSYRNTHNESWKHTLFAPFRISLTPFHMHSSLSTSPFYALSFLYHALLP